MVREYTQDVRPLGAGVPGAGGLQTFMFPRSERFAPVRCLGAGGFGVVYEAHDRLLDLRVALKVLHRVHPTALYRFKQEFRALQGIVHPHLVTLHHLHVAGDVWFFTMDFIAGTGFLEHVWDEETELPASAMTMPPAAAAVEPPRTLPRNEPALAAKTSAPRVSSRARRQGPAVRRRLKTALRQLAEGIRALHAARRLHCDIKPSNVLVTPAGRVVLLDFGLVTELDARDLRRESDFAGTPGYMSPEQLRGASLSEASDWYSVGALLHEALWGHPPLASGAPPLSGASREPAAAGADELERLCLALLRPRPEERPTATEIFAYLREEDTATLRVPLGLQVDLRGNPLFVGRERELAFLEQAYEQMKQGQSVAVRVIGASGLGKSTLVDRFADRLQRRDQDLVLLLGRCYERESVPFKGIDNLVDGLCRFLCSLPAIEVGGYLPRDTPALARLFPVLRRVDAVAELRSGELKIPDLQEVRRRAFGALRELLARIAQRRPLVLVIDDVQWGDGDSAALLAEVLRLPAAPPLLLVLIHRPVEQAESQFLELFAAEWTGLGESLVRHELKLAELDAEEAHDLARLLLQDAGRDPGALAMGIARDSAGNPFFLQMLAHGAAEEQEAATAAAGPRATSLAEVVAHRLSLLSEPARRLLASVSLAGRPMPEHVLLKATGPGDGVSSAVAQLRSARFITSRPLGEDYLLETYHDRVRQAVLSRLSAVEQAHLHLQLARTLEAEPEPDPQVLVEHFHGAGDAPRATHYGLIAAAGAMNALAFDRAAQLYRLVLTLSPEAPEGGLWQEQLAEALAQAGRCGEAGDAFVAATRREAPAASPNERRSRLHRRAADQWLRAGRIDEGLTLLREGLQGIDLRYPETPRAALFWLLKDRIWLALRGLRFKLRREEELAPAELRRIDTCWDAAVGHSLVDPIRSGAFQSHAALMALELGEPKRLVRALGGEACYVASIGGQARWHRSQKILGVVSELAEKHGDSYARAYAHCGAGISAFFMGAWERSWVHCDQAIQGFREECNGATWEIVLNACFAYAALAYLGRYRQLANEGAQLLREIDEKGDVFGSTTLRVGILLHAQLAQDRPEDAARLTAEGMARWTKEGTTSQHYLHFLGQEDIALYRGEPWAAWARLLDYWPKMKAAFFFTRANVRAEVQYLRARSALAAAATLGPGEKPPESRWTRERLLKAASQAAQRLAAEELPHAGAFAAAARAGIAQLRGEAEEAVHWLKRAREGFELQKMAGFAAAAQYHLLQLAGAGRAAEKAAPELALRGLEVVNPPAMARLLVPVHGTAVLLG